MVSRDEFDEGKLPAVLPVTTSPPSVHLLSGESLRAIIENYLRYYASGAGHTARAKRYDLQYFLEHLAGGNQALDSIRVSDWTLQSTQSFVDYRLSLGESPATVSRRLATIKHFGRTLAERVHGYINPAREVKGPVQQVTRPQGLTAAEIEALRTAARPEARGRRGDFLTLRDQFLVELLLATGLRADEVRLLLFGQLSGDRTWLKNVKTKGRKFRNVYLDSNVRELLATYLTAREHEVYSRYPLLRDAAEQQRDRFPVLMAFYRADPADPQSFMLSPKSVWRIIAQVGKKARALLPTARNLHPHLLRHTFAHGLLDSSKDVRLVAQALGHSDVRTTMRYTERTEEEIARAIEKKLRAEETSDEITP